jgi:HSP20 family protein
MHQYSNYARCAPASRREHLLHERFNYRRPKYNVPVNTIESETYYEIHVYALGFEKAQIKVSVVDDVLCIKGTRTVDENNLPNFIQQEYPIRSFERKIQLRGQVDIASITARHEEGILKLRLPKTAEAQKASQEIVIE